MCCDVAARAPTAPLDARLLLPSALLAATLFLLSADLLFVSVAGQKIKFGYFLILAMWLFAPAAMYETAKAAMSPRPALLRGCRCFRWRCGGDVGQSARFRRLDDVAGLRSVHDRDGLRVPEGARILGRPGPERALRGASR